MSVQVVRLQVTDNDRFTQAALKQRIAKITLTPDRGDLVDRFGVPLAISVREWRLAADPQAVADLSTTAQELAATLGLDETWAKNRLDRPGRYVVLAHGLDQAAADKVRAQKKLGQLEGVFLEETPHRVYPAGDLARSVLGRVNRATGKGETGLERLYDEKLTGRPGELLVERDKRGKRIPAGLNRTDPSVAGTTYVLTLDRAFQYAVDGMHAQALANTRSRGGIVLVSDVKTGDLLAVSNMRVNDLGEVVGSEHNAALVSVFEPGSTNKVITIAAALEEGTITPETRLSVPDTLQVSDHRFKDDEPHREAMYTPGDILTASSNIGTIKIAQSLGRKEVDRYLRGFGLGDKTAIDFPGESGGILLPVNKWTGTSIGTVPIGQGLAVTAAQMLSVYATIANDGVRVPLRLVRGSIDADANERPLPEGRNYRVVSEKTANVITEMLERVVVAGTGTQAQVTGYRVAGKTGTAQKPEENARGYKKDGYVASFAGFFPADRPQLAIIVILDEPQTSIYGGAVAAPLFAEVANFAGHHYRIAPSKGSLVSVAVKRDVPGLATSREMQAVRKAGTWQGATIRRAALRQRVDGGPIAGVESPSVETRAATKPAKQPVNARSQATANGKPKREVDERVETPRSEAPAKRRDDERDRPDAVREQTAPTVVTSPPEAPQSPKTTQSKTTQSKTARSGDEQSETVPSAPRPTVPNLSRWKNEGGPRATVSPRVTTAPKPAADEQPSNVRAAEAQPVPANEAQDDSATGSDQRTVAAAVVTEVES